MLNRLVVKNFRLLRDVEIDFPSDAPVVLIGPNGGGKSTVLAVVDFLSRCANDGLAAAVGSHGGFNSLRTAGAQGPIDIEAKLSFSLGDESTGVRHWNLTWRVSFTQQRGGAVSVLSETLTNGGMAMSHSLISMSADGRRMVSPEGPANRTPPSEVKEFDKLAFEALVDPERFETLTRLKFILGVSRVVASLATAPGWAREGIAPSARDSVVLGPEPWLGREGFGLANALYNLQTHHGDVWEELERAFRGEFPYVKRLLFPADVGGSRIAVAFEDRRFGGRLVYASEMSDGMIAYLCLLASLLYPAQIGVLGLDEPEAHLHPSALHRFMALAHRPHGPRRLLAIVTHSNALLDELRDPAKSIRVVEAGTEGARIRPLDAEALDVWRKQYSQGSLSEMRRSGLLTRPTLRAGRTLDPNPGRLGGREVPAPRPGAQTTTFGAQLDGEDEALSCGSWPYSKRIGDLRSICRVDLARRPRERATARSRFHSSRYLRCRRGSLARATRET